MSRLVASCVGAGVASWANAAGANNAAISETVSRLRLSVVSCMGTFPRKQVFGAVVALFPQHGRRVFASVEGEINMRLTSFVTEVTSRGRNAQRGFRDVLVA
ncbi:hypothetical protein D9M70_597930 [compost metagenome]